MIKRTFFVSFFILFNITFLSNHDPSLLFSHCSISSQENQKEKDAAVIQSLILQLGGSKVDAETAKKQLIDMGAVVIEPLLETLKNEKSEKTMMGIIEILGILKANDAVPTLISFIQKGGYSSNDDQIGLYAIKALKSIGDQRTLEPIFNYFFKYSYISKSEDIIDALSIFPKEIILKRLLALLEEKDYRWRHSLVLDAVAKMKESSSVAPVINYIESGHSQQNTLSAIRTLGEIGDITASDFLLKLITEGDQFKRNVAVEAICKLDLKERKDILVKLLFVPDLKARGWAEKELNGTGWKPSTKFEEAAIHILKKNWDACKSIRKETVILLISMLESDNGDIRLLASEGLMNVSCPEAKENLIEALLKDPNQSNSYYREIFEDEKYNQYGSENTPISIGPNCVKALAKMGWKPSNDDEKVAYYLALNRLDDCTSLSVKAVPKLIDLLYYNSEIYDDDYSIMSYQQSIPPKYNETALKTLIRIGNPAVLPLLKVPEKRTGIFAGKYKSFEADYEDKINSGNLNTIIKYIITKINGLDIQQIIKSLDSDDPLVVERSIIVLGEIKTQVSLDALMSHFIRGSEYIKLYGNSIKNHDEKAIPALEECLSSPNIQVKRNAMEVLLEIGKPIDDEKLIKYIYNIDYWEFNETLYGKLKTICNTTIKKKIYNNIPKDDDYKLYIAVNFLNEIGNPEDCPKFYNALLHKEYGMVITTADAFSHLKCIPEKLDQKMTFYVAEHKFDLIFQEGEKAIPHLVRFLNEEGFYQREVANTLMKLGWQPKTDEEMILYYLALNDEKSIIEMGTDAVEPLIKKLKKMAEDDSDDESTIQDIFEIFGEIRDKRSIEPMLYLFPLPYQADIALYKITGMDFEYDQLAWQEWWEKNKDTFEVKKKPDVEEYLKKKQEEERRKKREERKKKKEGNKNG